MKVWLRKTKAQKENTVPKEREMPASDGFSYLDRVGDAEPSVAPWPAAGDSGVLTPKVLDNQPALQRRDWLPDGVFPEVDALREEHHAHIDECIAAGQSCSDLRESYEQEDRARAEALRTGDDVPTMTSSADRQDALGLAEAERKAAVTRFGEFAQRAIATFSRMEDEWRQRLNQRVADAEQKRQEAQALLAQAEAEMSKAARVAKWVDRMVKPRGGRYMSAPKEFGTLPGPTLDRLAADGIPPRQGAEQELEEVA